MKKLIILFALLLTLGAKAQTVQKEPVYKYIIVTMENADKKGKIKVLVDNGVKNEKLKDVNDETVVFKTKAGILMYFLSKGWEFVNFSTSTQGAMVNGIGASTSSGMWFFRQKTTKEELDSIVEQTIKE